MLLLLDPKYLEKCPGALRRIVSLSDGFCCFAAAGHQVSHSLPGVLRAQASQPDRETEAPDNRPTSQQKIKKCKMENSGCVENESRIVVIVQPKDRET